MTRRRDVAHLRSLSGVEHRLRRSAGARPRVAGGRPAVPAARRISPSCSTSPPRPRCGARPRAAIATSATWRCCRACATATTGKAGSRHWVVARRRARQIRRHGGRAHGSRDTARAAVSARTSFAPALEQHAAHASSVAPVVLTSSTRPRPHCRNIASRVRRQTPRERCVSLRLGKICLRRRAARRRSAFTDRHAESACQLSSLIEPARQLTETCNGTGTRKSAPSSTVRARLAHQRAEVSRNRAAPAVLQRVHAFAQCALVDADCAARRDQPRTASAARAASLRTGSPARHDGSASPQQSADGAPSADGFGDQQRSQTAPRVGRVECGPGRRRTPAR